MEKWRRKSRGEAFIGLFAFVLVVLVVAACFLGLWALLSLVTTDEGAPFMICLITAALAVVYQITNTRIIERKLPIEQERRAASAAVYQKLLNSCFATLGDLPGVNRIDEQKLLKACHGGMEDIMVYGSDEVVHFFGDFINLSKTMDAQDVTGEARGARILKAFERLLQAMRNDVGHESSQLRPGNLKRVFMPDCDAVLNRD